MMIAAGDSHCIRWQLDESHSGSSPQLEPDCLRANYNTDKILLRSSIVSLLDRLDWTSFCLILSTIRDSSMIIISNPLVTEMTGQLEFAFYWKSTTEAKHAEI